MATSMPTCGSLRRSPDVERRCGTVRQEAPHCPNGVNLGHMAPGPSGTLPLSIQEPKKHMNINY
eukprot:1208806-Amphidinium_carterae.2